jgi:hypothetical protein
MSETDLILAKFDAIAARMEARFAEIKALLDAIHGHLADLRRERDVPLEQRGFGVMDEPPA